MYYEVLNLKFELRLLNRSQPYEKNHEASFNFDKI
jgi:hypothetical protein